MSNRRIPVCDDDELLVDLLTYWLGNKGYELSAARDGAEALERLAADKPDALVIDATMPVIDGFEVLRRIREQPATKSAGGYALRAPAGAGHWRRAGAGRQ